MINAARLEMAREPMVWWALLAAFSFMFALVLSANLFADAVQNAFDPRVRTSSMKTATVPRRRGGNRAKAVSAGSASGSEGSPLP
jgi:peptide/nickel transport system permease protein